MSCDAAAALFLFFASAAPGQPAVAVPAVAQAPVSVAAEPLFVDIVLRARGLEAQVKDFQTQAAAEQAIDFTGLKGEIVALADLDMKGHLALKERGVDGDLKCILRGISQDLPVKLADLEAASGKDGRIKALKEMGYLLRDNIEVILAPQAPPV